MRVLTDIEDFVSDHRRHGSLTADATEPRSCGLTRGFRKRFTCVGGETVRKLIAGSLLAVALLLIQASAGHAAGPEFPRPPGFRGPPGFPSPPGFPGPPRFHGHSRGDGDFRGDGVIVVGPSIWWDPWRDYPPPYPPPEAV